MPNPPALVFSAHETSPSVGILDEVLLAWPARQGSPRVERCTPEALAERLERAGPLGRADEPFCVLLAGDDALPAPLLRRLCDLLRDTLTPGLVLTTPARLEDPALRLASGAPGAGGVLGDTLDAPRAPAASALAALAARQHDVRALSDALHVAQASGAGLRRQMDHIHEELQIASMVQREFLPRSLPRVTGVDLSLLFRPAGYVSGDVYDVQRLEDGRVSIFVADAVGHGVPAAMMTLSILRAMSTHQRAGWDRRDLRPEEVMARLNEEICRQREGPHRYATAVYALLDVERGELTLSGAGHPAPLHLTRDGATPLEAGGPLLGAFPDAEYEAMTVALRPGETVAFYSDGLEAAFTPARRTTGRRERTALHLRPLTYLGEQVARGDAGLGEALDTLAALIDAQSGSLHQPDDVTVLALSLVSEREQRLRLAA